MKTAILCLFISLGMALSSGPSNDTQYYEERIPDEQRLFQEIMDGYEIAVRPLANESGVIVVKFGLRLNQIIDLDERHQMLTTNVFIDQVWNDPSLKWDPDDFNRVESIRIPSTKVWLPDTFIYNNADGGSTGFVAGQYVLVSYSGDVLWPVPVKLRSSCQMDIKYFPFDDQQCILRFGSWIYNDDALRYEPLKEDEPVDTKVYVNNSEWDLRSISLEISRRGESCCVEPHTDLVYKLNIRRRTFFYVFNVIIPCIMLSVLTLLTFWVPATSGEKVTLGLSVFLAFSMFMLLIAEEVPASSESVPLIGIYLSCVMTMTSFSVIMAVLVINIYHRGVRTPRAPAWLRFFCLRILSTLLCITHDIKGIAETITLDEEQDQDDEKENKKKGNGRNKRNGKNGSSGLYQMEVHPRKVHRTNIINRTITWRGYDRSGGRQPGDVNTDINQVDQCPTPSTSHHEAMDMVFEQPDRPGSPPRVLETNLDEIEDDQTADQADSSGPESYQNHEKFHDDNDNPCKDEAQSLLNEKQEQNVKNHTAEELLRKKVTIVEWQRIAAVIDRLLFWLFFLGTLTAYLIILVIIPENKKIPWDNDISSLHAVLHQS